VSGKIVFLVWWFSLLIFIALGSVFGR